MPNKRVTPEEFDFKWFRSINYQKRNRGNQRSKKIYYYKNLVCAFDIETSRILVDDEDQSIMYIWQFQFGTEYTVLGRTWAQFQWFMRELRKNMMGDGKLCVFVHNLSYEFQFLSGIYNFKAEEIFAIKSRKVLRCDMLDRFEFRCSYLHSNMSLALFTKTMGAEHQKLSGEEFDYSIVRYPWTPMTDLELDYCVNDVLGLVESIIIELEIDHDNLYSYPLTSTGYVRRDAKIAMRTVGHQYIKDQYPTTTVYNLLREAFRGGSTHANRYYAGQVIHNVKSADRVSSYPAEQVNSLFPIKPFTLDPNATMKDIIRYINVRHKPILARITFMNIRLRNIYWGAPYIPRSKCRNILNPIYDNGRILSADMLEITVTDIDLSIILEEYEFDDAIPTDVHYSTYGKLPPALIEVTKGYFNSKTELKNVQGKTILYSKSKAKLNAIYGMSAQDPVKQSIDYINNEFVEGEEDETLLLQQNMRHAFLNYAWGVWITAHARFELEQGIKLAEDTFVYCDTDSVKYFGEVDWSEYNTQCIARCKESGGYATDPTGITHYLGVFEQETDMYEFCTLGAKKYCFRETPSSEFQITIAGVPKKKGAAEMEKHGGIEAFKEGFIFSESGKTESLYNDLPEPFLHIADGHQFAITNNVVIRDTQYTLGITGEYSRLLESCKVL